MPHGVLFRGGEEHLTRQYFIQHGYLEAVIGLPANLFYGTGIPACILALNKQGAKDRDHVLFINADREYREGRARNYLRPEDIDKIIPTAKSWTSPAMPEMSRSGKLKAKTITAIKRWETGAIQSRSMDRALRRHLSEGLALKTGWLHGCNKFSNLRRSLHTGPVKIKPRILDALALPP